MFREYYGFNPPKENVTIWRYTNFLKFVDLLDSEELFFCRVDRFDDPFEGIFRLKDYEQTKVMWENQEEIKKFYFVNCWHINEVQSDAMWKIYLETKNGIAIKSDFKRLKKAIEKTDDDIQISRIRYIDHSKVTFSNLQQENQIFDGASSVNQFTYKRSSFEHEKELRLFFVDLPIPGVTRGVEEREPLLFKRIKVDLDALIEEIIIAPFADSWFPDIVSRIMSKYGRKYKISQSKLYEK